jgi:hypothetical protein
LFIKQFNIHRRTGPRLAVTNTQEENYRQKQLGAAITVTVVCFVFAFDVGAQARQSTASLPNFRK